MKKKSAPLIFSLVFCLLFTACSKGTNQAEGAPISDTTTVWKLSAPVPFGGYICGFSSTSTFLQLPLVMPAQTSIESIMGIRATHLLGDNDVKFECASMSLDIEENPKGIQLNSFSFDLNFGEPGYYIVNKLSLLLSDGTSIIYPLNDIEINVSSAADLDYNTNKIEPVMIMVNQGARDEYTASYKNITDKDCIITGLSHSPTFHQGGDYIKKYPDFNKQLAPLVPNDLLAPNEEATFFFKLKQTDKANQTNYWYLPFIYFSIEGKEYYMPSQYQPLVIDTPYEKDYLESLIQE